MRLTTILFAKYNIEEIAEENGIKPCLSHNSTRLHIELASGRTFELSEKEIKYQAIQYLNNQIHKIENNL